MARKTARKTRTTGATRTTGTTRRTRKTRTPRTVRVGVVGLGMGKYHLTAYRDCPGVELAAVCDVDKPRLDAAAKEFGIPHTFTDADAMYAAGVLDAVSVATPNFLHHPLTMAALNAGLHVLCEKPMAMNAKQAKEMLDTAQRRKLTLGMHFNHRMTPAAQAMARYTRSGQLGEIYHARICWHRRRGIPGGPGSWFFDRRRSGGGCLIDLGVHALDGILYLLGYPDIACVSAQTQARFGTIDKPGCTMDVEDFVTAYLRTTDGASIALEVSWASHHEHAEQVIMALYGSEGGIVRRTENYVDAPIAVYRREHGALADTHLTQLDPHAPSVQADFVAAIRDRREPICSGRHGLVTMQVIDGIYRSARTGREVRLTGKG